MTSGQGFGLTIGSDLYILVDPKIRRHYYLPNSDDASNRNLTYLHGAFTMLNGTSQLHPISGVLGMGEVLDNGTDLIVKGMVGS